MPQAGARDGAPAATAFRRAALGLFLAAAAVYCTSPVVTNGDSYLAVPTAESILRHADLTLDEYTEPKVTDHYAYVAVNGKHFDYFPWPVSLFALPAVAVVDGAHALGVGPGTRALIRRDAMGPLQLVSAGVTTAAVVAVIGLLAFECLNEELRRPRRTAVAVAVVFALGTQAWSTASRALWQHGPSLLFLSLALLMAVRLERPEQGATARQRRQAAALGAFLVAAYVMRPTNAIPLVLLTAWTAVRRPRLLPAHLGGATAVAAAFVAVNLATFDRLLPPYYAGNRLGLPGSLGDAFAANLVSPNRGLLVFSPVVVLAVAGLVVARRRRSLSLLDVVAACWVIAHLVAISAFRYGWWAGHAFGPRFMTETLPPLTYLSLPAVESLTRARLGQAWRVALGAVLTLSAWSVFVNAQGAYLKAAECWNVDPANIDRNPARVWSWDDPQFVYGIDAVIRERPLRRVLLHPCPPARRGPTTHIRQ